MLKLMENDTIEAQPEISTSHGHNNGGHGGGDPDALMLMTLMNPTLSQKCNPFLSLFCHFLSLILPDVQLLPLQ